MRNKFKSYKQAITFRIGSNKIQEAKDDKQTKWLRGEYKIDNSSVIGSLIYLLNAGPDIIFAVTKLENFMRGPGWEQIRAQIHLLQYLRDNTHYGITFYRKVEDTPVYDLLTGAREKGIPHHFWMHNTSWQDYPDNGCSTGPYVIFHQGSPFHYNTFVPSPMAIALCWDRSVLVYCGGGVVFVVLYLSLVVLKIMWANDNWFSSIILWRLCNMPYAEIGASFQQ